MKKLFAMILSIAMAFTTVVIVPYGAREVEAEEHILTKPIEIKNDGVYYGDEKREADSKTEIINVADGVTYNPSKKVLTLNNVHFIVECDEKIGAIITYNNYYGERYEDINIELVGNNIIECVDNRSDIPYGSYELWFYSFGILGFKGDLTISSAPGQIGTLDIVGAGNNALTNVIGIDSDRMEINDTAVNMNSLYEGIRSGSVSIINSDFVSNDVDTGIRILGGHDTSLYDKTFVFNGGKSKKKLKTSVNPYNGVFNVDISNASGIIDGNLMGPNSMSDSVSISNSNLTVKGFIGAKNLSISNLVGSDKVDIINPDSTGGAIATLTTVTATDLKIEASNSANGTLTRLSSVNEIKGQNRVRFSAKSNEDSSSGLESGGGSTGDSGSGNENDTDEKEIAFVDVSRGTYYFDAVAWAAGNNITTGVDPTHFNPGGDCIRGQVVTFLWRAAGSPEPTKMSNFTDVKDSDYYAKAVAWAVEKGITTGTSPTTFNPNGICTREQFVTFLWRAANKPEPKGQNKFSDVAAGKYYTDAVTWAAENGITTGVSPTKFDTGKNCLRGQVVTFLYRYNTM